MARRNTDITLATCPAQGIALRTCFYPHIPPLPLLTSDVVTTRVTDFSYAPGTYHYYPLHHAARKGHLEIALYSANIILLIRIKRVDFCNN